MSTTLFIADVHLDDGRPQIRDLFLRFLEERARGADALYILGDLFEYWVGDDDPAPAQRPAIAGLRWLSDGGVPIYFQHGNRDFLAGDKLAGECGWTSLPETATIDLYGEPVLILHGDSLCTDDHEYAIFRDEVRSTAWRDRFLSRTLEERHAQAGHYRTLSRQSTRNKPPETTDVNAATVASAMRAADVTCMIHGHTHRPAIHDLKLDGRPAQRIVLGDWHERGSFLSCVPGRKQLKEFT